MRPLDSLSIARESIIEAAHRTMREHMQETYIEERDGVRLSKQREAVLDLMRDGRWRTLAEISAATSAPEASVSARLRDLRKQRYGSYQVDRAHVSRGLWRYRIAGKDYAEEAT